MFPNVVNCTTIVWYRQWPDEGLQAVAEKAAQEMFLEAQLSKKLVAVAKFMHTSAISLSAQCLKVEGRHNYVTPSSYLELLQNMKVLLMT